MRGEKGFALVITLIVTALMVAVAGEFIHEVYVETSLHRNRLNAEQASLFADAGCSGATALLKSVLSGQGYSSLLDSWAQPQTIADDRGTLTVTIEEESGKLDLNSVVFPNGTYNQEYYGIALRLLKRLELPGDLCEALADWIDTDDEPRPAGGEKAYYGGLNPPYAAKNGRIDTFGELGLIRGFTTPVLKKIQPFVTVHAEAAGAPSSKININTAPREILESLDERMNGELAQRILDYRATTPFKSVTELSGKIPGMESIGPGLIGRVGVKGAVFRIRSTATVGEVVRIVESVVRINGTQSTVLYWREF